MRPSYRAVVLSLSLTLFASSVEAQTQSRDPADEKVTQKISRALAEAGIDSRTNSVKVVTTSDHAVNLTGLISDRAKIKLAGEVATKTAPSLRVVNQIHASFFDDPNHVTGDKTK